MSRFAALAHRGFFNEHFHDRRMRLTGITRAVSFMRK